MTDVFEARAKQLLKLHGCQHVPVLVTPNPVMYLEGPEIQERVDALLDDVISSLKIPDM